MGRRPLCAAELHSAGRLFLLHFVIFAFFGWCPGEEEPHELIKLIQRQLSWMKLIDLLNKEKMKGKERDWFVGELEWKPITFYSVIKKIYLFMEEAALTSIKSIISFPSITPKSIHFLHFFAAQLSGAKKLKENWSWLKADCSCASEWRKEKWVRQSVAQRKGIEGWVGLVSWWRVNGWWASQWLRQKKRTQPNNSTN